MAHVGFYDNGYDYFDKNSSILFSADKTHNYLFDYIANDLSSLPELFEKYISKRIDPFTLKSKNHSEDIEEIKMVKEILMSAHPYYKYEYKKVIIKAIGDYFNKLLIYLVYSQKKIISDYPLNQEWYYMVFHSLVPPSLTDAGNYPDGLFPLDFHKKYKTWVNDMGYRSNEIEETFVPNIPVKMPVGFSKELKTQRDIKNLLYFILDTDAQSLEDLSVSQRIWLYGNMFYTKRDLSEMRVTRKLLFHPPAYFSENSHAKEQSLSYLNEDIKTDSKTNDIFCPFYTYPPLNIADDGIPEKMIDSFNAAVNYAKTVNTSKIYEEYEINDLQELLSLEILAMIQSKTIIKKCENCGKYFIFTDKKKKYCDRPGKDGTTCYKISKKKRFQQKLHNDPAFKLYNTAYKAHYAQYKSGNMTQSEFNSWQHEAYTKLEQVRADELDIFIFQKWLKNR